MKTTSKKILLGLGIALLGGFSVKAQSGLEGIIVEKYYQANAADVTNAFNLNGSAANPGLSAGSITYRVYVDLAAGWKFNQVYGNAVHPWKITTTTAFYNDPQNFAIVGAEGTPTNVARQNTRMIDSYITTGGAATNKAGVLESEDTDGTIGNAQSILANNPGGIFGAPINGVGGKDGLLTGTSGFAGANILVPTPVGLSPAKDAFDYNVGGNTFSVTNGAMAALGGIVGTGTSNIVFIGQFTTDGVLGFELNVQLQNIITSGVETWVANNPQFGEFTLGALTLAPPTVSISSPANNANIITGTNMTITANATSPGTVTSVQFLVDGSPISTDLTAPYEAPYTTVAGTHTITAIATDNNSLTATSSPVIINVANNQAPIVSVASATGALVGSVMTFTANAIDLDGTVASVSFSVDNVAIGTTTVGGPIYTFTWTAAGTGVHNVKASAADNLALVGVSSPVSFNVVANILPTVVINTPLNNSSVVAPQVVTITATASDADGNIALIEAFVNNVSIGTYTTAGPNYSWTYATSTLTTLDVIKVVATDNSAGTTTSSPVSVNIINSSALPYVIGTVKQQCNQGSFCLPISTLLSYSVANVIGYDIQLYYDPIKVTPTGSITVNNTLINPSYVTVVNSFASGTMNISAYFNNTAPALSQFQGTGDLFCVGFNKATMAPVDAANFSVNYVKESYYTGVSTKTASAGQYITYRDSLFDADLKFWGNNGPLPYNSGNVNQYLRTDIVATNATCTPNSNTLTTVQPDLNGHIVYDILNGSSIMINRDIAGGSSVLLAINGNDVFDGRQVLLNTPSFTPTIYQMIALDVNMDGNVSSGDLSQMNQRNNLIIPEFKQAWNYNTNGTPNGNGASKDWVFVDSTITLASAPYAISATYPNDDNVGFSKFRVPVTPFCLPVPQSSVASCPTINNEVYKGIMVGDVDGNFNVTNPLWRSSSDKIIIDLENAVINGKTIDVPVSFISAKPVVALDFELQFDESNMTFNSMVNYPSVADPSAYFNPNDKTLRFTTTNVDISAYRAGSPVASIRFETQNGAITKDQINALTGVLNGQQVNIEVSSKSVGINSMSAANNAVSVYPNPTNGILNITSISDATIELCDVTGKEIFLQTSVSASKTQQINVSGLVNGVYIVKVYNKDFITIKKVVLNK